MEKSRKRVIQGEVVTMSGDKTANILVARFVVHPKYRKYVKKFKKYLVHDEKNELQVGDIVTAVECRPLSKNKSFMLESFTRPESVE